jgi:hypothetical protein
MRAAGFEPAIGGSRIRQLFTKTPMRAGGGGAQFRQHAATLRQLCEHVEVHLGPFGAGPVNLMLAVDGHLHHLLRTGGVLLLDPTERPPRFQLEATAAP